MGLVIMCHVTPKPLPWYAMYMSHLDMAYQKFHSKASSKEMQTFVLRIQGTCK